MDSALCRFVRFCGMRTGTSIAVRSSDRARLEALVVARGSPQEHVWRGRIILLTADGLGTVAVMAATGKSKTCVSRWQERFMAEGVDGLLRDKTRPPGTAPLEKALVISSSMVQTRITVFQGSHTMLPNSAGVLNAPISWPAYKGFSEMKCVRACL